MDFWKEAMRGTRGSSHDQHWHPPSTGSRPRWHWRTGLCSSLWARDTRWGGMKHSWRGKATADMPRLILDLTHTSRDRCRVWEVLGWATGSSQDQTHNFGGPWRRFPGDPISQGTPLGPAPGRGGFHCPTASLPSHPSLSSPHLQALKPPSRVPSGPPQTPPPGRRSAQPGFILLSVQGCD